MKHLGLFEGIGGFSLAARWMGWETKAWCEWNPFCQTVLKHHFPEAEPHSDITKTDFTKYANTIDILTGGFPCQPYSLAGKRLGKEDERHLWPEMLRAIREIKPRWIVGENVGGLISWNGGMVFNEVQTNLEAEGYEVQAFVIPACAVNAPHRRDRVWIIAHSISGAAGPSRKSNGTIGNGGDNDTQPKEWRNEAELNIGCHTVSRDAADTSNTGLQRSKKFEGIGSGRTDGNKQFAGLLPPDWEFFPTQPPIRGRNDGISDRLDRISFPKKRGGVRVLTPKQAEGYLRSESIKAYGNAIVPQVALQIFKAIQECETQ